MRNNIKKFLYIVLIAVMLLLVYTAVMAEGFELTVNEPVVSYIEKNGARAAKQIQISGTVSHEMRDLVSGFLYSSDGRLTDISVTYADESGEYTLIFVLNESLEAGIYTTIISSPNCTNSVSKSIEVSGMGTDAEIKTFSVAGVSASISGESITVKLNKWKDLQETVPVFTVSKGAAVYINDEIQISGTSKVNFNGGFVTYRVVSEDLNKVKEYKVTVSNPQNIGGVGSGGGGGSNSSNSSGGNSSVYYEMSSKPTVSDDKDVNNTAVFKDISDYKWAEEYILKLNSAGIINGYEDNTFRPGNDITREEFVKMIVFAMNISGECTHSFKDMPINNWAYNAVSAAYKNKIVSGISDELFGTGEPVTRQDMAVIAYRAVLKTGEIKNVTNKTKVFADEENIASYAKEAVHYLHEQEIINGVGDNMFMPEEKASRAEAAKIIYLITEE